MVLKPEQERVKTLLSDTVTLLCRNGLTYNKKFSITALIGITLDDDDVVLVEIKETVKNNVDEEEENSESESYQSKATSRKRKRKRRHSRQSSDSDNENGAKSDQEQNSVGSSFANPAGSDVKREQTVEDDSDEDLVFIKDEPGLSGGDMSNLYSQHNDSNQMYSSQQPPPGDILGNLGQQGQLYATPASSEHIGGPLPGPSTSWSDSSMSQQFPGGAGLHGNALSQQAVGSPMQGKSSQKFECPKCQQVLSTQSNLRQHLRRHMGIYSYHCHLCLQGFSATKGLRAHLIKAHAMTNLEIQCPLCHKGFTRKETLDRHMTGQHADQVEVDTESVKRTDRESDEFVKSKGIEGMNKMVDRVQEDELLKEHFMTPDDDTTGAGTDGGADAGANAGANAVANTGAKAGANAGADARVNTRANVGADTGNNTRTDTGANARADGLYTIQPHPQVVEFNPLMEGSTLPQLSVDPGAATATIPVDESIEGIKDNGRDATENNSVRKRRRQSARSQRASVMDSNQTASHLSTLSTLSSLSTSSSLSSSSNSNLTTVRAPTHAYSDIVPSSNPAAADVAHTNVDPPPPTNIVPTCYQDVEDDVSDSTEEMQSGYVQFQSGI